MIILRHKNVSSKEPDSFKQQHDLWLRAYAEARSVRERFPKVEQLVVEMVFTDLTQTGRYSSQMRSFSASAKAFFAIACPRTLCLDGGFDLDSVICALLGTDATQSTGILECRGRLKSTHTQNARCLLQAHYRLQVLYDAPEASPSKRRARL
jgi:hypothetical protein